MIFGLAEPELAVEMEVQRRLGGAAWGPGALGHGRVRLKSVLRSGGPTETNAITAVGYVPPNAEAIEATAEYGDVIVVMAETYFKHVTTTNFDQNL